MGLCFRLQNICVFCCAFWCALACAFFLCWTLEFVAGFVLQASKTVVLFLCSLLQSSLQIFGQTDGLVEIVSKVVSWFRHWPGQVAPWPRWPGARQPPASSFSTLYYLPSGEFRNSRRLAAKILNPLKAPSINSSTLHDLPSGELPTSGIPRGPGDRHRSFDFIFFKKIQICKLFKIFNKENFTNFKYLFFVSFKTFVNKLK